MCYVPVLFLAPKRQVFNVALMEGGKVVVLNTDSTGGCVVVPSVSRVSWRLSQIEGECLGDFEMAAKDKGIACWNQATQEQVSRRGGSILFFLRKQTESMPAAPGL